MGVYIKDMEMPKTCDECALKSAWCIWSLYTPLYKSNKRPDECPLVPVPPHGDLIDRDAAKEIIKPWSPEDERSACTFDTVKKLMHTMLDRAPTIIQAEPAEEGET